MTVSLVARDAESGRLGVVVASLALAVGARVPHVRSGVAAVAVQAGAPTGWGELALDGLSTKTAEQVVEGLWSTTGHRSAQVAVVDAAGHAAGLTGPDCEPEAGHVTGSGACAAANLMERRGVPEAVVLAYERSAATTFDGRLLDAIGAADEMGGDVRGRQSAALVVVPGADGRGAVDLRVDDARDPVGELRRLHVLHRAHELLDRSRGPDGLYRDAALAAAALSIAPSDLACLGGAALASLRAGRVAAAAPLLRRLQAAEPRTAQRLRRLVDTGRLDADLGRIARHVVRGTRPHPSSPSSPLRYPLQSGEPGQLRGDGGPEGCADDAPGSAP